MWFFFFKHKVASVAELFCRQKYQVSVFVKQFMKILRDFVQFCHITHHQEPLISLTVTMTPNKIRRSGGGGAICSSSRSRSIQTLPLVQVCPGISVFTVPLIQGMDVCRCHMWVCKWKWNCLKCGCVQVEHMIICISNCLWIWYGYVQVSHVGISKYASVVGVLKCHIWVYVYQPVPLACLYQVWCGWMLPLVWLYQVSCSWVLPLVCLYQVWCGWMLPLVWLYQVSCSWVLPLVCLYQVWCGCILPLVWLYQVSCGWVLPLVCLYQVLCGWVLPLVCLYQVLCGWVLPLVCLYQVSCGWVLPLVCLYRVLCG